MIEKIKNNEAFNLLEQSEVDLNETITMLWYVMEDYYVPRTSDIFTKANSYDRLETFLYNIHTLLLNTQNEMKEFIENTYKEARKEKGENKDDCRQGNENNTYCTR